MSMSIGPTLADAKNALHEMAHNKGGIVDVVTNQYGTTVDGQSITSSQTQSNSVSKLGPEYKTTMSSFTGNTPAKKDTITFSASALAALSQQQIALALLQDNKSKSISVKPVSDTSSVSKAISDMSKYAVENSSASSELSSGASNDTVTQADRMETLRAYAAESPADRFYAQTTDPSAIVNSLASSNPQQAASFLQAYNNKTLSFHIASDFGVSNYQEEFNYTDMGSGTGNFKSGDSSKSIGPNVIHSYDGITDATIITW